MFFKEISPLLLNIPIVVSIIAFTRYIIGFKTWRNYPTVALALAFYIVAKLNHNFIQSFFIWLILFVFIIGSASTFKYLIRKLKINYYARSAIVYLGGTIGAILSIYIVNLLFQFAYTDEFRVFSVALILSTIDEFGAVQLIKGNIEALRRTLTSFILGLLSGILLSSAWWNNVIYKNQWILLLVLCLDFVVAFWSSLRLTELSRFSAIINRSKAD